MAGRKKRRELDPIFKVKWTPEERQFWLEWIDLSLGATENQDWHGHCPMHDTFKESPGSATFRVIDGTWRCQRPKGQKCTEPKTAGTMAALRKYIEEVIDAPL